MGFSNIPIHVLTDTYSSDSIHTSAILHKIRKHENIVTQISIWRKCVESRSPVIVIDNYLQGSKHFSCAQLNELVKVSQGIKNVNICFFENSSHDMFCYLIHPSGAEKLLDSSPKDFESTTCLTKCKKLTSLTYQLTGISENKSNGLTWGQVIWYIILIFIILIIIYKIVSFLNSQIVYNPDQEIESGY